MSRYNVVIADNRFRSYDEERGVLDEVDAAITVFNGQDRKELEEAVREADGVLVNLYVVDKALIRLMKRCQIICRYGVGYDNVDVDAATKAGIWVARVPDFGAEEVADQALALLFGCIRKIGYKDRRIRKGAWNLINDQPCYRTRGKVLGILGYGLIGRTFHRKVAGIGFSKILICDPYIDPSYIIQQTGAPVTQETLFKESDYISIHVPLTAETRHLINEKALKQMKGEVILVNTSRGSVIDEKALCNALEKKVINSAGLDVFETEPPEEKSPLRRLDNVILSDHTGYYSEESLVELKTKAARNVAEVLKGGKPIYPLNQP
jgi:D-3-phosphoglycerate dehydrogenase